MKIVTNKRLQKKRAFLLNAYIQYFCTFLLSLQRLQIVTVLPADDVTAKSRTATSGGVAGRAHLKIQAYILANTKIFEHSRSLAIRFLLRLTVMCSTHFRRIEFERK